MRGIDGVTGRDELQEGGMWLAPRDLLDRDPLCILRYLLLTCDRYICSNIVWRQVACGFECGA